MKKVKIYLIIATLVILLIWIIWNYFFRKDINIDSNINKEKVLLENTVK